MSGTDDQDRLQRIRDIAYDLWEKEGRPEGRDHEFWVRAEAMVDKGETGEASSERVDEESAESFPASDPPSFTR
ncbi:DUF2934 domain-containing protein [Acidisoma sp. C75]